MDMLTTACRRILRRALAKNMTRRHTTAQDEPFSWAATSALLAWLAVEAMPYPGKVVNEHSTNHE